MSTFGIQYAQEPFIWSVLYMDVMDQHVSWVACFLRIHTYMQIENVLIYKDNYKKKKTYNTYTYSKHTYSIHQR